MICMYTFIVYWYCTFSFYVEYMTFLGGLPCDLNYEPNVIWIKELVISSGFHWFILLFQFIFWLRLSLVLCFWVASPYSWQVNVLVHDLQFLGGYIRECLMIMTCILCKLGFEFMKVCVSIENLLVFYYLMDWLIVVSSFSHRVLVSVLVTVGQSCDKLISPKFINLSLLSYTSQNIYVAHS